MNIGKKILSALVEVTEETPALKAEATVSPVPQEVSKPPADGDKFRQHFDKLFADANLPGPDYYEFARMVDAMKMIPDEKARYAAAFAGLSVQGLDKEKLVATAAEYLMIVEADATSFQQTLATMRSEKVERKQQEIEEKNRRIEQLSQEITELHNRTAALQQEIRETEEKISVNSAGYLHASEHMKDRIAGDIQRIKQHVMSNE